MPWWHMGVLSPLEHTKNDQKKPNSSILLDLNTSKLARPGPPPPYFLISITLFQGFTAGASEKSGTSHSSVPKGVSVIQSSAEGHRTGRE